MLEKLTPREKEFLSFAAQGLTNEEIAQKMFISPSTAKTHLYQIYEKFNLNGLGFAGTMRLKAILIYQKEKEQEFTGYGEAWEKLFKLMDEEELTIKDFFMVICTKLQHFPEDEYNSEIELKNKIFEIRMRKK